MCFGKIVIMPDDNLTQHVSQLVIKVDNLAEDVRETKAQMVSICADVKAVNLTVDRLYNEMHLPGAALTDTVAVNQARLTAAEDILRHHVELCEEERARIQNNKWQLTIAMLVAGLALIGTLVTIVTPLVMAKGTP